MAMEKMLLVLLWFVHIAVASEGCPPLPGDGLPNGQFLRIDINSVQMKCDHGFVLVGNKRITCRNGTWIPPFNAECFRPQNICPPPPDVPNAERDGDNRKIGSRTYYHCQPGYFMHGRNMIMCDEHLLWDNDPPVCIERINKVSDIAERIRNEAGLREEVEEDVESNVTKSDMKGLILDQKVFTSGLELFLLLDRSSSVDPIDLELSKSFFRTLIETFGVDNSLKTSKTRLTVISFGDKADVVLNLTDPKINNVEAAMLKINAIKPEGGGTAMTAAMSTVVDFLERLRKEAKKALFLLTDGEPTIGQTMPEDIAAILKDIGFEIFTVGIGRNINKDRLLSVASEPFENHALFLETFQDFKTILDLVRNPPPTVPPVPPPGPDACGVDLKNRSPSKPWLTAIVVNFAKENNVTFCAGVQICSQWVLTSAACVGNFTGRRKSSQIALIVGANDLTTSGHNAYAIQVRISTQEPEGRGPNFKLALIELNEPVPSAASRPICLYNHSSLSDPFFREKQQQSLLEGWGTRNWNSSLSSMTLSPAGNRHRSLASNVTTLQEYLCSEAVINRTNIKKPEPDEFICAGSAQSKNKDFEKDSCVGSLGSPLVIKDGQDRYQLLGVQTHHHGCVDQPIIYKNIEPYLKWIESVTQNCQANHRY